MYNICYAMNSNLRSLSSYESKVVLSLVEDGRRELDRAEVIAKLGVSPGSADLVIRSLRRKGWLERAGRGRYLLIPPDQGPEVIGESNILALASRLVDPYYIGYGTAAAHYGLITQVRNVVWIASMRLSDSSICRRASSSALRTFPYSATRSTCRIARKRSLIAWIACGSRAVSAK